MSTLFYVSYVSLWVLCLVQAVLLFLVYRHFGIIALGTADGVNRDGLAVGKLAPIISGVTARGKTAEWSAQPGRAYLLLFAAPGCKPCSEVLPTVKQEGVAAKGFDTVIIVPGQRDAVAQLVEQFQLPFVCLAEDGSGAADRYQVRVTPFAFVVGKDGRILAKGLCSDAHKLRHLLSLGGLTDTVIPVQHATQASESTVPDMAGKEAAL